MQDILWRNQMIKKLKIKFVILSMSSLFVLLSVVIIGMNIISYSSIVNEVDDILSILSKNKGLFPNFGMGKDRGLPPHMSPELPYESRYFSVVFDVYGNLIQTNTSRIASVDTSTAVEYAKTALKSSKEHGFLNNFRYAKNFEGGFVRITFLDCGRKLDAFKIFLFAGIIMASAGFFIVFFVILFFSGKFIRPIAESYEKQKRFITDAGHEIKTPLTIIGANAELLEMAIGENECLNDIRQQIKHLTNLTNDLVYLAKMEESENSLQMIEFPLSDTVYETAVSFKAPAQTGDKQLELNIEPLLCIKGDNKAIEQLVYIILDNAFKYSPKGGIIRINLYKQNKGIYLNVSNTVKTELTNENLRHIFDRFYRTDQSRNSETGGHGIGLSMAKAIVTAHGGKIQALTNEDGSFCINVFLPVQR